MAYTDLEMLIFSEIAYMDLKEKYDDRCLSNGTTSISLEELLNKNEINKIKELDVSEEKIEEIKSWKLVKVYDDNKDSGFYACVIETSPGNASIAFRGSEGMGSLDNVDKDWVNGDLALLNSIITDQQKEVDVFLDDLVKNNFFNDYNSIALTGHSLGGNLAEYAAIRLTKIGLDKKITQCVSLDGPGFSGEFIEENYEAIEKISGIMYHPRWSLVGTLLNDLPGVDYKYIDVENKDNQNDYLFCVGRHGRKYVTIDSNENFVEGEQDTLSKITSVISKGLDRLPAPIGNALVTIVGSIWISVMWAKENCLDENNNLTESGWTVIIGIVGVIAFFGITEVITAIIAVVVILFAIIIVAACTELLYELVNTIADAVCSAVSKIYGWTKEEYNKLKDTVFSLLNKVNGLMKNVFDGVSENVHMSPQITLDTYNLDSYAQRLRAVSARVSNVDSRLNSLYWSVGLRDLWSLRQTNVLNAYRGWLNRCADYLTDTAGLFNNAEADIIKQLQ